MCTRLRTQLCTLEQLQRHNPVGEVLISITIIVFFFLRQCNVCQIFWELHESIIAWFSWSGATYRGGWLTFDKHYFESFMNHCIASLLLTEGAEWLWPSGLLFRPFLADFASWDLACCSWGGRAYINNGRKGSFELEIERSPSKQELCHFVAAPWRQSQPPQKAEGGWTEHTRAGNQEIWVILCSSGNTRYKTSKNLVRMRPGGWTEHTRAGFFCVKVI